MLRCLAVALLFALALPAAAATDRASVNRAFSAWIADTAWPAARREGVSRATFEAATAGLTPDWRLPDLTPPGSPAKDGGAFQAEFTGPGRYLANDKLAGLAASGRKLARTWSKTLAATERRSGVPAGVLLAIWGRESAFGAAPMPHEAVRALATQAFMGARREIFLPELVAALRILEEDHVALSDLRSSWAGAMGQPQFMPTKFLAHALDADGDGRRDIWGSVPDTLGSIGNYLAANGWQAGVPWGVEVKVPAAVSCALEGPEAGKPVADWAALGVTRTDGRPVARRDVGPVGHLLMPAGRMGPAFLVSENFYVIKRYNESDVYAVMIGHVGDRIGGDVHIEGRWQPVAGHSRGDVRRLQRTLEGMGHDVGSADGLVGWRTRVAIGRWQEASGRAATCFPDEDAFAALR